MNAYVVISWNGIISKYNKISFNIGGIVIVGIYATAYIALFLIIHFKGQESRSVKKQD